MGRSENSDWDLASVGDEDFLQLHNAAVGAKTVVHRIAVMVGVAMRVGGAVLGIREDGVRIVGHGCVLRSSDRETKGEKVYIAVGVVEMGGAVVCYRARLRSGRRKFEATPRRGSKT